MSTIMPLFLKCAAPLVCLLTALMVVIHAQTFDAPAVRAFLMPDDCAMPCFMGITPGVTTTDEAVRLLQSSGWVENLNMPRQRVSRDVNELIWQWNDKFPFTPLGATPYGNFLTVHGNLVDSIVVATSIKLADVYFTWHTPAQYRVTPVSDGDRLYYGYVYPQQGVYVVGEAHCPFLPALWTNATNLIMGARRQEFQTGATPNDGLFLRQVVQFDDKICRG